MSDPNEIGGATNPSDAVIREILGSMKCVAVVGLSAKQDRASHGVARFMIGKGFEVIGVNPLLAGQDVLGLEIVEDLVAAGADTTVDVVNVFRRSETVPPVIDAAIAIGTTSIWLQEGVVHETAAQKARDAGINVIQDRCLYKEWLRLMNG